jgi:hypothetical protein
MRVEFMPLGIVAGPVVHVTRRPGPGYEHHLSRKLVSMSLADQDAAEWAAFLRALNDADLLSTAGDCIWLAEFGPVAGRNTFTMSRDGVVSELRSRGMDEQLAALRQQLGEESGQNPRS